jgi:RNA polymerase subunit RPABC4/transcription elongation factor Spt4
MTLFLVGWPGGSLESALKLGALILLSYALVLWLSAVIWVYRDVKNRTSDQASQVIAVLLVATFNLPGLIVYLVIRPQVTMADAYERSLEAEAVLHELQITANSCQTCRRPIDDDFNICPHCRTLLREPCRSCSRLVRTSWIACPYCGVDRVRPQPQQVQQRQHADSIDAAERPLQRPARRTEAASPQRDLLQQTVRQPASNGGGHNPVPARPAPRERS